MKNSRKYNMIEVHFLYDKCEYNKDTANSRNKIKLKKKYFSISGSANYKNVYSFYILI